MPEDVDLDISKFEQIARDNPSSAEAHANLGSLYSLGGRYLDAVHELKTAVELDPSSKHHFSLGQALYAHGDADGAIKELHEALKITPQNIDAQFHLGLILEKMGRIDEAIEHYLAAITIAPSMAPAHHRLGRCLEKKGMHKDAIAEIVKAINLDTDFGVYHYDLGTLYLADRQFDAAIREFQDAIRLEIFYPEARRGIKQALEQKADNVIG